MNQDEVSEFLGEYRALFDGGIPKDQQPVWEVKLAGYPLALAERALEVERVRQVRGRLRPALNDLLRRMDALEAEARAESGPGPEGSPAPTCQECGDEATVPALARGSGLGIGPDLRPVRLDYLARDAEDLPWPASVRTLPCPHCEAGRARFWVWQDDGRSGADVEALALTCGYFGPGRQAAALAAFNRAKTEAAEKAAFRLAPGLVLVEVGEVREGKP